MTSIYGQTLNTLELLFSRSLPEPDFIFTAPKSCVLLFSGRLKLKALTLPGELSAISCLHGPLLRSPQIVRQPLRTDIC
jgi:hypothetical protein